MEIRRQYNGLFRVKQAEKTEKGEAATPKTLMEQQRQARYDRLERRKAQIENLTAPNGALDHLRKMGAQNRQNIERRAAYDAKQRKISDMCAKIRARLRRGQRVSPQDLQFLRMNEDPTAHELPQKDKKQAEDSIVAREGEALRAIDAKISTLPRPRLTTLRAMLN